MIQDYTNSLAFQLNSLRPQKDCKKVPVCAMIIEPCCVSCLLNFLSGLGTLTLSAAGGAPLDVGACLGKDSVPLHHVLLRYFMSEVIG